MATDRVKQFGKDLGKTYKDIKTSKTRIHENFPVIEKTRDLIALQLPYNLEFNAGTKNSAYLNIRLFPDFDPSIHMLKATEITITETGLPIGKPGEVGVCGFWYQILDMGDLNLANGPFYAKFEYSSYLSMDYHWRISFDNETEQPGIQVDDSVTMVGGELTITISTATLGLASDTILPNVRIYAMADNCEEASWIHISNANLVASVSGGTSLPSGELVSTPPISTGPTPDTSVPYVPIIAPPPDPLPEPIPGVGGTVTVYSIPQLKTALADNSIGTITVANGTYSISTAASQGTNSLWINNFVRTNPVLVRAETSGGVIFDGGGATYFGGITFNNGSCYQTWDGFIFQNGSPTHTGVVVFGGYAGMTAPHHITLRNITVRNTWWTGGTNQDHAIYYSKSQYPGPNNLLIENFTVTNSNIASAHHFYHDYLSGDESGMYNCRNVVIRVGHIYGTYQPIIIWARTIQGLVIEDIAIYGALEYAVRYEYGGGITLRRVTTTDSGYGGILTGYYNNLGSYPNVYEYNEDGIGPEKITFDSCYFG